MNQNIGRIGALIAIVVVGALGVRLGLWDQGSVERLLNANPSDAPVQTTTQDGFASAEIATHSEARSAVGGQSVLPQDTEPQCGEDITIEPEDFPALYALGQRVGVRYPATFARVVDHLYDEDRLPGCYLTKNEARDQGWQRGTSMNQAVPGGSIGGDYFGNREGRLPAQYNGDYREADLDYVRGGRGATRLVYVRGRADEGLIWVTTDHYESFTKVYCGARPCD